MLKIARKTAKTLLPKSTVYRLKRQIEQNRFERYAKEKLELNFRLVSPGPVPPKELIAKTAALNEQELARQSNSDVYFETGYYSVLRLLKILEHFSINPRTIGSIFELGCGTARLLRHFRCMDGVKLVGSDVNPEMIEWCRANLPEIEFYQNELVPPLNFAEDNSFDLMLASSVFTHIPLDTQELWLAEMQRILHPGGIFICSVLGQNHASLLLGSEEMQKLKTDGSFTLTSDDDQATYSTRVGGSAWDVFQTRAEVIRVFGSFFQIVDYIPGGQDFLVLRKPDPAVSVIMNSTPFPAEKI
ncbi:trans-aconitate 2-methyltransferase [Pleurocapsa sp. PCC 7319]|uniref:class I SAM-dependent methyltransferase n=1 Tax=Pleurocapsa sp. PCC 7319 TaxID=118161 RepID=UPI00034CD884|nr:class I SAM-dependent methyltransferase [Pleurocapsa sp. PCC 7319]